MDQGAKALASLGPSTPSGTASTSSDNLTSSGVDDVFKNTAPRWSSLKTDMPSGWSPCQQTLEGHSDQISSVAFSHDSALLASASDDKTVRVWRTDTGDCIQTLEGHSGWVISVAFSHDSALLTSASDDKTVRVWRTDTGDYIQTLEGHSDTAQGKGAQISKVGGEEGEHT